MKKYISIIVCFSMIISLICLPAYGDEAEIRSELNSRALSGQNVPVGSSSTMELDGIIKPMIMSVTVPSKVPFVMTDTGKENKVISPRINIVNNSNVAVAIDVQGTYVDLSNIPNATWSNSGVVTASAIAVGFKAEASTNEPPVDLNQTRWLSNVSPVNDVLNIEAFGEKAMYVVGNYGPYVDRDSTFKVVPTIVVRAR